MDTWTIRQAVAADLDQFLAANEQTWGQQIDPEELEEARLLVTRDTALIASRGGDNTARADATFAHYQGGISVPGTPNLDCDFVTWVAVRPDARRQGALKTMMAHYLADAATRNVGWSTLWASEPGIYGRFGYGLACTQAQASIGSGQLADAAKPHLEGTTYKICPADSDSIATLHQVWKRYGDSHLGVPQWRCTDKTFGRTQVASAANMHLNKDVAVVYRDDQPVAAAMIERRPKWENRAPVGTIYASFVVSASAKDRLVLAHHLSSFDLFTTTKFTCLSADDPMIWAAGGPSRVGAVTHDGLWMRPVHADIALASRTYSAPIDLTIAISEAVPGTADTVRLVSDNNGDAECTATTKSPDVTVDSATLGALSFGAFTPEALTSRIAAGNVVAQEHTAGSLETLFQAARSDRDVDPLMMF